MYEVGQVLFVVLNKRPQIIPVQVTEQVVRRSIKGENIQYSVDVPTKEGNKAFELSGLNGDVYNTLEEVQEAMFANAKSTIAEMTNRAASVAKSRFGYEQSEELVPAEHLGKGNGESVKITLDDGVIANVVLPDGIGDSL
jgi:hypothetical protein